MTKFSIHPVVTGKPVFLPLVSNPVAAGFPSLAAAGNAVSGLQHPLGGLADGAVNSVVGGKCLVAQGGGDAYTCSQPIGGRIMQSVYLLNEPVPELAGGRYAIFDENGRLIGQSDDVDAAFGLADAQGVKVPALVDLELTREHSYVV